MSNKGLRDGLRARYTANTCGFKGCLSCGPGPKGAKRENTAKIRGERHRVKAELQQFLLNDAEDVAEEAEELSLKPRKELASRSNRNRSPVLHRFLRRQIGHTHNKIYSRLRHANPEKTSTHLVRELGYVVDGIWGVDIMFDEDMILQPKNPAQPAVSLLRPESERTLTLLLQREQLYFRTPNRKRNAQREWKRGRKLSEEELRHLRINIEHGNLPIIVDRLDHVVSEFPDLPLCRRTWVVEEYPRFRVDVKGIVHDYVYKDRHLVEERIERTRSEILLNNIFEMLRQAARKARAA